MNDFDFSEPSQIPFQEVIDALLDENTPFSPRHIYRCSDLNDADFEQFKNAWPRVSVVRKRALLEDLDELFGDDYLLSFEAICRLGLDDADSQVRFLAVRSLWDYAAEDLIPKFLNFMETDPDPEVRAAATTALGKYIYLGEIEELPVRKLRQLEERLLQVMHSASPALVRRRALESLGWSSRKEIPELIQQAYDSGEEDWIISALFAMGRTYDARWHEIVLQMLEHSNNRYCYEAVRSAGELEINAAVPRLIELLEEDDEDIRSAAIWSLSQIGGHEAHAALLELADKTDNEDETELIDEALDNLIFNESIQVYDLMDLPEDDEDAFDFFDLEEFDEEFDDEDDEDEDDGD